MLGAKLEKDLFGLEDYKRFNETEWWRTLLRLVFISIGSILASAIGDKVTIATMKAA